MELWNNRERSKSSVFDALAAVVKATANPRRLELVELLAQGEHSVETLARMSAMGVTTTSAHLQTLKRAGLVQTRRERSTIYYRLAGDDVAELYLAAKRVGLRRSPEFRETVDAYAEQVDPGQSIPLIDASAVTSQMTVIDVRPRAEFDAGHFPGAVSLPLAEIGDRYAELAPGATVVVYCRGELCRMAREAARWLADRGIDARLMSQGVIEWRATKEVHLAVA